MNNEPVAWLVKNRNSGIGYVQTDKPTRLDKVANEFIPLYTHPAKTIKNLKDGELPVLTVTVLDCNGKLIRSVVSFKETRIICDSLVDELRKAQSNCNGFCGEYECKENQGNCKRKAQE